MTATRMEMAMPVPVEEWDVPENMDAGLKETDEERRERLMADPAIDPRLRDLYLDKELLSLNDLMDLFDITRPTVGSWSAPPIEERRPHPNPKQLPPLDQSLGVIGGRVIPGRQRGRMYEWGAQKGWWYWHRGRAELVFAPRAHRGGPKPKARVRQG